VKGSTIKRGSTWTAYWSTVNPATGGRRQHSKGGFVRQKDARTYLNEILSLNPPINGPCESFASAEKVS
jgi:hypothetical protein